MTDEELARELYEKEAKNWPSPTGWDNLTSGSRAQWIYRAKYQKHKTQKTGWPPPPLMQDDDKKLSKWFASKSDARRLAREAGERIRNERTEEGVITSH